MCEVGAGRFVGISDLARVGIKGRKQQTPQNTWQTCTVGKCNITYGNNADCNMQ